MTRRPHRSRSDPHRAVAYLRVSTDEQHLGPEAQREAIEAWASRAGVVVAHRARLARDVMWPR